jgi:hypothetical protein
MEHMLPELTPLFIGTVGFIIGVIVALGQRRRLRLRATHQADSAHSSAA